VILTAGLVVGLVAVFTVGLVDLVTGLAATILLPAGTAALVVFLVVLTAGLVADDLVSLVARSRKVLAVLVLVFLLMFFIMLCYVIIDGAFYLTPRFSKFRDCRGVLQSLKISIKVIYMNVRNVHSVVFVHHSLGEGVQVTIFL